MSLQGYLNDQHERSTSESLFGGLVQGKVTSLDARLEIPELPDDIDSCSRWVTDKNLSNHRISTGCPHCQVVKPTSI